MTNRTPARDRPGALGWRRGSQYRGSRVTPVEGRDLSSRLTQQVVRDLEIGQPINSENCSETAEGVHEEFSDSQAGPPAFVALDQETGVSRGVVSSDMPPRLKVEARRRRPGFGMGT